MKNGCRLIENPKEDVIVDVDKMFGINDGIISIGIEEIREVISGADNVLILFGKGLGVNRVSDAIEDAVLHTCEAAPDYDLFTAEKVIVQLNYSIDHDMLIDETSALSQFSEMFPSGITFLWGISKSKALDYSDVIAQIISVNLKKK